MQHTRSDSQLVRYLLPLTAPVCVVCALSCAVTPPPPTHPVSPRPCCGVSLSCRSWQAPPWLLLLLLLERQLCFEGSCPDTLRCCAAYSHTPLSTICLCFPSASAHPNPRFSTPLFWGESQLSELAGTTLAAATAARKAALVRSWSQLQPAVDAMLKQVRAREIPDTTILRCRAAVIDVWFATCTRQSVCGCLVTGRCLAQQPVRYRTIPYTGSRYRIVHWQC